MRGVGRPTNNDISSQVIQFKRRYSPLNPVPGRLFLCRLHQTSLLQKCCPSCSCIDTPEFSCGFYNGFDCRDPACFDSAVVAEFPDCTGDWLLIGDGSCNAENNLAVCGWDGGDCCKCTCHGVACSRNGPGYVANEFSYLDARAGNELYDCKTSPPAARPCSADVRRIWLVNNATQARALAAAINCSGGSFEVEWRGHIVVDEAIHVTDRTVLTVTGAEPGAVVDGNGSTRLFTVVNATLHLINVNISFGASVIGGAIAAAGSTLTLNRTNFVGNRAAGSAGAVYVSDGSSLTCVDVSFLGNRANSDGGAVYATGSSVVSCGGVWLNNTAGRYGGALSVDDESKVSLSGSATYTGNSAGYGGAMFVAVYSSVSWTGPTKIRFDANQARFGGAMFFLGARLFCSDNTSTIFTGNSAIMRGGALDLFYGSDAFFGGNVVFESNSAFGDPHFFESGYGGALTVSTGSSVSWNRDLDFSGNSAEKAAGALYVSSSTTSWSGRTTFAGNTAGLSGGALFVWNGSHVAWTGDTNFTSNDAGSDGGAVGSPVFDSEYNFLGSVLVINGSTAFVNNTSGANGGALALSEGVSESILTTNVSFTGDRAKDAGGAVYVSGAGLGPTFTGMSFISNSAQVGGAASIVASGNLKRFADIESPNPTTFDRCSFVNNRATATGGAIESAGGQDLITNSVFEGNRAGVGGALRLAGMTSVANCSFVENISDDEEGAAISNIGSISTTTNNYFSGNAFYCQPGMFLDFHVS